MVYLARLGVSYPLYYKFVQLLGFYFCYFQMTPINFQDRQICKIICKIIYNSVGVYWKKIIKLDVDTYIDWL